MSRTHIFKVGETYKGAEIVDVGHKYNNQTLYTFRCPGCDKKVERVHAEFIKKPFCTDCLRANTESKKFKEYSGKTINGIKILNVSHRDKRSQLYVNALCPKCNKEFVTTLARIKTGIGSCKDCAKENLDLGHEFIKNAAVDGTVITAIDGHRAINKNNTAGYKGVSFTKSGKYRAYIYFKRKQYYLGTYSTVGEAAKARKIAEEKIYGDFLRWYAETYPDNWKKINKSED